MSGRERANANVAEHGSGALVADTTSSAAVPAVAVAAERKIPVAYFTGLMMCRAAELSTSAQPKPTLDARVLADYAWRNADPDHMDQRHRQLLARLCILNVRETDLGR